MAKKKTAAKSMELDAKEFFAAISDIEKEKGIPKSYMIDKITQALVAAYKRDHAGITDNVIVDANEGGIVNEPSADGGTGGGGDVVSDASDASGGTLEDAVSDMSD